MREELRWPGGEKGIDIFVLHKAPDKPNGHAPLLMLHPFGAPCADGYDLPGYSWMDDLNAAGFDTWAIDFRGFARSSKPASATPVGPARDAVGDVRAIIDGVKARTGAPKVSLVGWSWGGVVAAMTAIADPGDIDRMLLLGTMRGFVLPMMTEPFAKPGTPSVFAPVNVAYQKLDASIALAHWRMMLKGIETVAKPDAVEKAEALMRRCGNAVDVDGKAIVTRPMGPLADLFEIWLDRPIFDASAIKVPTLVVYGDADLFADRKLAKALPQGSEQVLPRATHWVPFEDGRTALYEAVRSYLLRSSP
jgi:pimeloyl-ACP methyl ester carboxylesterase